MFQGTHSAHERRNSSTRERRNSAFVRAVSKVKTINRFKVKRSVSDFGLPRNKEDGNQNTINVEREIWFVLIIQYITLLLSGKLYPILFLKRGILTCISQLVCYSVCNISFSIAQDSVCNSSFPIAQEHSDSHFFSAGLILVDLLTFKRYANDLRFFVEEKLFYMLRIIDVCTCAYQLLNFGHPQTIDRLRIHLYMPKLESCIKSTKFPKFAYFLQFSQRFL